MLKNSLGKKLNHLLVIPLVILSLIMPACMPKIPGFEQMRPEYYPQCYQPLRDLEESQTALLKRTMLGVATGSALGALFGGLKGGTKGLLVGIVGGASAGGLLGYGLGKMVQIKDDKERMRSYQADMDVDMLNASRVEQYAMASMECYNREFKRLIADYKQGRRSKEEVEARYQEIRRGLTHISGILKEAREKLEERDKEYRNAFEREAKEKGISTPNVASIEHKRIKNSKIKNTKNLDDQIKKRQENAKTRASQIKDQRNAFQKNGDVLSVDNVADYYEGQYLDSLVSLDEAEVVNRKNLDAIEVAAQSLGLDAA